MTDQKNEKIIQSFKKKKKKQLAIIIAVFAMAFFAIWFSNNRDRFPDETIRMIIAYSICAITLGGLILSYFNWRCPACGKYLGRAFELKKCRKCGARLR
jgi:RsiW-degrading membrane proteinase PrsW (M82 family)